MGIFPPYLSQCFCVSRASDTQGLCVEIKRQPQPCEQTHPHLNQVGIFAGTFRYRELLLQTVKTHVAENHPRLHACDLDIWKEPGPVRVCITDAYSLRGTVPSTVRVGPHPHRWVLKTTG